MLLLDVRSKTLQNPNEYVELDDAEVATLNLAAVTPTSAAGTTTYQAVPATLTADGARAFAGFYEAGAALDPITITITHGDGTLPPPTGPSTAPPPPDPTNLALTGARPWPLALVGALTLMLGVAVVYLQRRRMGRGRG